MCAGLPAFMESFGHYTILERLRVGALGELVRARDVRLGRTVALRLVSPAVIEDAAHREAFLAAAASAAALSHPHITALFDFGEENGRVFLAHEFVPGHSLRTLLTGKPVEASLALEFAVQLADALAEGHRQGVVHGNICPSAIFITPTDQTKIIGFGFAGWTSGGTARRTIVEQLAAGRDPDAPGANAVVPYMAPEQLLAGRTDHRADVFSLGVVLYEMLTGRAPFGSSTAGATAVKVLQGTPPPPSHQNKSVPIGFDAIVAKALAKSLDARYPSASDMVADLRALAAGLHVRVTAEVSRDRKETPAKPVGPLLKRLAIMLVLLAVVGGLGAAAWTWRNRITALFAGDKAIPSPVLVVMPFQMAGGEPGRDYFGVGFAEDLAARLGEVQGLTVVGRLSIAGPPGLSHDRAGVDCRRSSGAARHDTARPVLAEGVRRTGRCDDGRGDLERGATPGNRVRRPRRRRRSRGRWPTGWASRSRRAIDGCARREGRSIPGPTTCISRDARRSVSTARAPPRSTARRSTWIRSWLKRAWACPRRCTSKPSMPGAPAIPTRSTRRGGKPRPHCRPTRTCRARTSRSLCPRPTVGTAASALARALSLDPSCGEAWHHAGDLVLEGDPARAIAYYQRALQLDPSLDISRRAIAAAQEMLDRFARRLDGAGPRRDREARPALVEADACPRRTRPAQLHGGHGDARERSRDRGRPRPSGWSDASCRWR